MNNTGNHIEHSGNDDDGYAVSTARSVAVGRNVLLRAYASRPSIAQFESGEFFSIAEDAAAERLCDYRMAIPVGVLGDAPTNHPANASLEIRREVSWLKKRIAEKFDMDILLRGVLVDEASEPQSNS